MIDQNNPLAILSTHNKLMRGTLLQLKEKAIDMQAKQIDIESYRSPFKLGCPSFITDLDALAIGNGTFDTITIIKGERIEL